MGLVVCMLITSMFRMLVTTMFSLYIYMCFSLIREAILSTSFVVCLYTVSLSDPSLWHALTHHHDLLPSQARSRKDRIRHIVQSQSHSSDVLHDSKFSLSNGDRFVIHMIVCEDVHAHVLGFIKLHECHVFSGSRHAGTQLPVRCA